MIALGAMLGFVLCVALGLLLGEKGIGLGMILTLLLMWSTSRSTE